MVKTRSWKKRFKNDTFRSGNFNVKYAPLWLPISYEKMLLKLLPELSKTDAFVAMMSPPVKQTLITKQF